MRGRLKLFSTRSLAGYRREVGKALRTYPRFHAGADYSDFEGELTVSKFADGEMEAEIGTSVRGCDVFLIAGGPGQSASRRTVLRHHGSVSPGLG